MMKKKKWIYISVLVVILIVLGGMIPTLSLKTGEMKLLEGEWVDVYYENEEAAAQDVFELAEQHAQMLMDKMGFETKQPVAIYIYDSQKTMQAQKYGLLGPVLGLDWYIGDNIGTDVILTSPANPGPEHSYESVKEAVLHEMVHAYITVINPDIALWLTEGMALYLANGMPFDSSYLEQKYLPSYEDIQTENPIEFSEIGGYMLAHTYIEYIDTTYGWDKVMEVVKGGTYEEVLGQSGEAVYKGWITFLNAYGLND